MTNTPRRDALADSPGEEMLLIFVALGVAGSVLASAGAVWLKGSEWLVAHRVLLPAAAHPVIQIPGTAGAGLDLPRVAIASAVAVAVLAVALSSAWRAMSRRRKDRTQAL